VTGVQKLTVICIAWTFAKNSVKKKTKFTKFPLPKKLLGKYLQNNTILAKMSLYENISRIRISKSFSVEEQFYFYESDRKNYKVGFYNFY
jgi:hypothetical protein